MQYIHVYGIEVGQTYKPADGSPYTVEVVGLDRRRDDVIVRGPDGVDRTIDAWKLVTARYSRVV